MLIPLDAFSEEQIALINDRVRPQVLAWQSEHEEASYIDLAEAIGEIAIQEATALYGELDPEDGTPSYRIMVEVMGKMSDDYLEGIRDEWFDELFGEVFGWTEDNPDAEVSEITELARSALERVGPALLMEILQGKLGPRTGISSTTLH